MSDPADLPLPDVELPDPTPRADVSHDQILDTVMAKLGALEEMIANGFDAFCERLKEGDGLFKELRADVNKVASAQATLANNQRDESRVISETLSWSQENGRKLDGMRMLVGHLSNEVAEIRQRLPTVPPPTIPAPPPELDADERTTPGYRVPTYDGDPGHE